MHETADFIARHAVAVLLLVAAAFLVFAACCWAIVERYAPRLWPIAVRAWSAFRSSKIAARLRRRALIGRAATGALTAVRYLGAHAVIAFAIAGGGVMAFFEVADEIGLGESLGEFDVALSAALHSHLTDETLRAFALITRLGDRDFLVLLAVCVAVVLLWRKRFVLAGAWSIATASGGVLSRIMKEVFERDRPFHDHGFVTETSFSFPSGHAAGAMLIYGLLCYLVVRLAPPVWRIPAALVAAALIIFVGFSRVILQVHYLSDVLAGYALSGAWAGLCIAGVEAVRRRGRSKGGAAPLTIR